MNPVQFILALLFLSVSLQPVRGQKRITIEADPPEGAFRSDHLKLGGVNDRGRSVEVNNYYVSMNGDPCIPVTGEFHYSRYPEAYWEESILKMKAGGITILATYVFWNIHEETEGVFDWKDSKDLRKFITLCARHEYDVIVRIGPFCHGEIRNGGLPDWLLGKPLSIRTNDPSYLAYVERLYNQIGKQLDEMYFKDGGPVLGIQLENEYQHSAAPWGLTYPGQPHDWTVSERDLEVTQIGVGTAEGTNPYASLGNEHMSVLKSLAVKAGMEVPIYTATGWGHAAIIENESLPVTAAYPYPTWAPEEPSEFYLYTELQQDPDYAPVRYEPSDYPYFAAELGGGIMNTYSRRPRIPAESLDPMINRFLGSGANGIGYYMYHGGSTPRGNQNYFNDVAIGCPYISYDFQAPIGEYGQARSSFHQLKPLHLFLNSFGNLLAPMRVVLPEEQRLLKPEDVHRLRYSIRCSENGGFLFLNNFQDHLKTVDHTNLSFLLKRRSGDLYIPEEGGLDLQAEQHAILPFGLELENFHLNYSTTQLLTRITSDEKSYVFFTIPGFPPEFSFRRDKGMRITGNKGIRILRDSESFRVMCSSDIPSEFSIRDPEGNKVRILVISREMARHCYPVSLQGKEHLMFTKALVLQDKEKIRLLNRRENLIELQIWPPKSFQADISNGTLSFLPIRGSIFSNALIDLPGYSADPELKMIQSNKYLFTLTDERPSHVNDLFLELDYTGDTGMGFINGELVSDHFYNGTPWTIGLKRFLPEEETLEMVFYFRPIYEDPEYLPDLKSSGLDINEEQLHGFDLKEVRIVPEYRTELIFDHEN